MDFAKNGISAFYWIGCGEGVFHSESVVYETAISGRRFRCRGRGAPSQILEHRNVFLTRRICFGVGNSVYFQESGLDRKGRWGG